MITYKYVKENLGIKIDRFHTILNFLGIDYKIGKGKPFIITEETYFKIKELLEKFGDTNELTQYMKIQNSLKKYGLISANQVESKRKQSSKTLKEKHFINGEWDFMDSHDRGKRLAKYNKNNNYEISKMGGKIAHEKAKDKIQEIENTTNYCSLKNLSKKYNINCNYMKIIFESLGYDDIRQEFGYNFVPKEYEQIYLNYLKNSKSSDSFGEKIVNWYLKKYNFNYEKQKTFDDCVYKRNLRFDFYIKDFNLCIEVDGDGHRKMINWESGMNIDKAKLKFEEYKIRDEIKINYCKNNNINLIRLEWDGNVKYLIKQLISKIKSYTENNIFYIDCFV